MSTIQMPRLGDVKKAEDLGYKSKRNMIFHACGRCGKTRWVRVGKGNQPVSQYCVRCGRKVALGARANFSRGKNREQRISEVWGEHCFTCGEKTSTLHRKDGKPHKNIRRVSVEDFQALCDNDKDEYVKCCKRDHPRAHRLEQDGWSWDDLEDFIRSLQCEETRL